jgi:signal peptidase I
MLGGDIMQANQDKQYAPPVSKSRLNKKILVLVIVGSLGLIALYFLAPVLTVVYLIQPVRVEGHAMAPTLNNGDKIFIQKMFGELNRGDIVVFLYPHDQTKSYIKRIIGLPGDTLDIKNGKVIVNGIQLEEPYIDSKNLSFDTMPQQIVIPPNQYFVIGDNRRNSSDSRAWGTVQRNLIYGRYWYRYLSASQPNAKN